MCIWVMPDRMANFGLTVKDLQDALKDQNRESAAGELGKQPISGQDNNHSDHYPGAFVYSQ